MNLQITLDDALLLRESLQHTINGLRYQRLWYQDKAKRIAEAEKHGELLRKIDASMQTRD